MRSRVTSLIEEFKLLNLVEQAVFLDQVDPEPEPEAPKQTRKKRTTKSAKAQSLSSAIAKTPKADAETGSATLPLEDEGPMCNICHHGADYQDHFKPSPNYHPFEPPAKRSRRNAAPTLSANAEPF